MNRIPVLRGWQCQIAFVQDAGAFSQMKWVTVGYGRLVGAIIEGKLEIRSEMFCFSSPAGCRLSLGNADSGQGDPRRRITSRKSLDQALRDFVGDFDRFKFSQRPGIGPAFALSMVRWPRCHG